MAAKNGDGTSPAFIRVTGSENEFESCPKATPPSIPPPRLLVSLHVSLSGLGFLGIDAGYVSFLRPRAAGEEQGRDHKRFVRRHEAGQGPPLSNSDHQEHHQSRLERRYHLQNHLNGQVVFLVVFAIGS